MFTTGNFATNRLGGFEAIDRLTHNTIAQPGDSTIYVLSVTAMHSHVFDLLPNHASRCLCMNPVLKKKKKKKKKFGN